MKGFTFNNFTTGENRSSSDFSNLQIKTTTKPLFASRRISKQSSIERDGLFTFVDGYDDKTLTITARLLSSNDYENMLTLRELAVWLNGQGELVLDIEPDKKYEAQLLTTIPVNRNDLDKDEFVIAFDCKPIDEANYENAPFVGDPIFVNAPIPVGGFVTSISDTGTENIENIGTYKAFPVITIDGTADSITLTNAANSETFTITSVTETTTVDCENLTVFDSSNKLSDFSGDFIALDRGDNNITVSGTNVSATVSFDYRQPYL